MNSPPDTTSGTCKVAEFKDSVFYKSHCGCMSDDHTQTLHVSFDDDFGVELAIYSEAFTNSFIWDYDASWYVKIFEWAKEKVRRVKWAIQIIFTGYIQVENGFTFRNEKSLEAYIAALQEGLNKVRSSEKYQEYHKNAT